MAKHIASTSLYYPFLTVDAGWLKASLLYWDSIRRIVPKEAEKDAALEDTPFVRDAVSEGLLISTPAEPYLLSASQRFRQNVFPLISDPEHEVRHEAKLLLTLPDPGNTVTWVHNKKISVELLDDLRAQALAKEFGDWVAIPDKVAGLYMVCLAAEMASGINEPLITDAPEFAPGGEYMLFGEPPNAKLEPARQSLLTHIGIDFPSPQSIASLSLKDLVNFRDRRGDERRRFRAAVESIASSISEVDDPAAMADMVNDSRKEVESAIADHRQALDEAKVKSVATALAISIPTVFTSKVALGHGILGPAFVGAIAATGVAINVVAWWADHRARTREEIKNCPWHYALTLEKHFPRKKARVSYGGGGGGSRRRKKKYK